jgi:hypothetical protein
MLTTSAMVKHGGLPMPRVEVIDVSDRLIENTDDLRVEVAGASIPCSSGRQLASLYAGEMVEASMYRPVPEPHLIRPRPSRSSETFFQPLRVLTWRVMLTRAI